MRVNWAAILLAGIADWLFGAVWFKLFAREWMAGSNPLSERTYAFTPNFWPFIIALLCDFAMALVIARVLAGSSTHSLLRGISTGVLVGLAAAFATITEMVFEVRPGSFILISAAYPLLGCILMGIIIGAWKPKAAASV